jgi:pimeloyl-ACP methyl ester carboxylesterase
VKQAYAHLYRDRVVGIVLVDSVHPAEWNKPTPEQLRLIQAGLRNAWIAVWLARLARGFPRLGSAAVSAFGASMAAAVQRIAGEIRKLPAPILPVVRALWSQPKNFMNLAQRIAALPASAGAFGSHRRSNLSVGTHVQLAAPILLAMRPSVSRPGVCRASAVLRVPAVQSDEDLAISLLTQKGVYLHRGTSTTFRDPATW